MLFNQTSLLCHAARAPGRRQVLGLALGALAWPSVPAQTPTVVDETWFDARRQRELPVRIRWPSAALPVPAGGVPLVLFSHGLGGSRAGGDVWGQAWAAAGFGVLHLQHAGSDIDAVRRVASRFSDQAALRSVGSAQQLLARVRDVVFALDEITRRQQGHEPRWAGVRSDALGLGGHSFGAHTTLGVGGQSYLGHAGFQEPRIAALIALSPTLPAAGDAEQAFSNIRRPLLCLTGTLDGDVLGNGATPERRRGVFAALPPGHKAQLVLHQADHMTLGGQTGRAAEVLPRESVSQDLQPAHHALIAAITTDWWRAHLLGDAGARARLLHPPGLGAQDVWQTG